MIEARLYISELMHLSPRTAADVEAAAALLDQSGTPLRLVMADFVVEGESVTWMEHDFARGLVAKVIEITSDNPPGKFLFNFDHIFGAILVWEPISATIFLLISFFFFVFSSRSIRDIVIAPLQKLLHALTSTASIISRDGRIVSDRPQDASPLDIGEASRRFLKLASRAVKYRNVLNGSSEGSGSGPSSRRHDSSKGNRPSGTSRALSFTAPMEPTSSREGSVAGEKADVRMKFSTAVLNGVGVRDWSACVLIGDELVQAVHLMWMKMRVPDRLCSRKTFVAWAHEVLNKHPSLEYHCAW